MIRTLGPEVEAALALPWRLPGMPYGDRLALSVSDVHFLDANAAPLAERTELLVTYAVCNRPPWSVKLHDDGPRFNTPFARFFDRSSTSRPKHGLGTAEGAELQLSLFCGDEAEPRAGATVAVPEFQGYRRLTAGLRCPANTRYARVHTDARLLTQEQQTAEQQAHAAWGSAQQSAFVHDSHAR